MILSKCSCKAMTDKTVGNTDKLQAATIVYFLLKMNDLYQFVILMGEIIFYNSP